MGITDGSDRDAEQLQLGAHVRPGERTVAAEQVIDGDLRHLVAGGDQAEEATVPGGTLADGIDVWIGGAAVIINHDAAALGNGQFAIAR